MQSPLPKNNNPKFYHLRNKIHKPGHTLHLQVLTRRQQLALKQLHDDEEGAEGKKGKKGKGKGKGRGKGKGKGKGKTKNKGKGAVSPKKPQKKVTPKKKASPKTKHESSTEDQEPLAKKPRTRKPKVEGTTIPDEPCPPPTSSRSQSGRRVLRILRSRRARLPKHLLAEHGLFLHLVTSNGMPSGQPSTKRSALML